MDDESKELLTISTHRGLYRYNRLTFGVASAPAIFQRSMESLLRGIPGVCVFFNDILVSGPSERDPLQSGKSSLLLRGVGSQAQVIQVFVPAFKC